MNDLVVYEREKAEKWLDENKELEGTTIYQCVLLSIAIYDVDVAMTKALAEFFEEMALASNVFTRHRRA